MESSEDNLRFDDLVRSERYFTATLLPAVLFHNDLEGLRRFVELVEKKQPRNATHPATECRRVRQHMGFKT